MKRQLLKKFFAFIPVSVALLFSSAASAQIVYTDVDPDSTVSCNPDSSCTSTYNLDLNHDGINDFEMLISRTKITSSTCFGAKKNSTITFTPLNANAMAGRLDSGAVIAGNLNWDTLSQIPASTFFICGMGNYGGWFWDDWQSGTWLGETKGYLPLRLQVGINLYYGWVNLKIGANSSNLAIKNYAYDTIPNEMILTGQDFATGILTSFSGNNFSIFPNPASDKITLAFSSPEKKEIQIINTLGQIVFAEEITSLQEKINLHSFPRGIYLVTVKTHLQSFEKKFLKQ